MTLRLPRYLVTGLVGLLILALALAMGYWNIRPSSFAPPPLLDTSEQPDFIMGPSWTLTRDEQGQPKHYLVSQHSVHHSQTALSTLSKPELTLFRPGEEPPWTVVAEQALIHDEADDIVLQDSVVIEQTLANGQQRRLLTEELTFFPPRDYAETDQPVRIELSQGVTTARGMQVFLNDSRLELLSTVRGHYEVN